MWNTTHLYTHLRLVIKCRNNKICNKSGFCTCKTGYRKSVFGRCVSACIPACINDTCTAQNRCICNADYRLRNKRFYEPICERNCKNGDCIGPNRCIYQQFYTKHRTTLCRRLHSCALYTRNCSGHGVCVIDDEYSCKCHFDWTGSDCDQPTMCAISIDTAISTGEYYRDLPIFSSCEKYLLISNEKIRRN